MATRNDVENVILFRVFLGGRAGNQVTHFTNAFGKIQNNNVRLEMKDVDDIKKLEWCPSDMIDWLLGDDVDLNTKTIFIILGHLHQGLDRLRWKITDLWEEYGRLRGRIGFPDGLDDPTFLQDKYNCLSCQDEDDILPTFKVNIPKLSNDGANFTISKKEKLSIDDFLDNTKEVSGCKSGQYVVKTPVTTHGSPYRVARRILKIGCLSNGVKLNGSRVLDQVHELPYCFIQPRVNHNREYKILCLGGKPRALVEVIGTGNAFETPLDEIFKFAKKVLDKVKASYPELMDNFIIRVDIFEVNGKLKLNEIESFDANYKLNASLKGRLGGEKIENWNDDKSDHFFFNFWLSKCLSLIKKSFDSSPKKRKKY